MPYAATLDANVLHPHITADLKQSAIGESAEHSSGAQSTSPR